MSESRDQTFRQDRRRWLQNSAFVVGGAMLPAAPDPIAQTTPNAVTAPVEAASSGSFFTQSERILVEELSETIIPSDWHSGGAKAAKVVDYIDQILRETVDGGRRLRWKEGLRIVNALSLHRNGASFVESVPEQKAAVLTLLSENDTMIDLPEIAFFVDLKQLTIRGYYTSKVGIHDELEYKGNRILSDFVGCDEPNNGSSLRDET